ncbi:hypothetical protein [Alkalihalobacillus sp. LMS39]|uniref:hypothetical protein n=1 Tax=Alkalihalobacillus sp. LMS39 TaxID=2924032 RepID=UPI001FB541E4|nr:hypothetical protein [Alkalihalobacillus sp. LMS39]UOE96043.1 hypothetical protein MM271_10780 [Alkalihalobacillus sp. LMS39]
MDKKMKLIDKIYLFLENRFILIVMVLLFLFVSILKTISLLGYSDNIVLISELNRFLIKDLSEALIESDGTLITLAAIFIGIYFTAFTLLATLSVKSALSRLEREQFTNLLRYIRNAFLASFAYVLFSLTAGFMFDYGWYFSVISLLLLTYMLLSALRFGLLIYIILNRDIGFYLNNVQKVEQEQARFDRILHDLEKYLEIEKNKQSQTRAEEISKLLEHRKKKKSET